MAWTATINAADGEGGRIEVSYTNGCDTVVKAYTVHSDEARVALPDEIAAELARLEAKTKAAQDAMTALAGKSFVLDGEGKISVV